MAVDNLIALAYALLKEPATSRTAEHLIGIQGKLKHDWETRGKLAAKEVPLPVPRDQGLHPVGCEPLDAFLDFDFMLGSGEHFPQLAEFQFRLTGAMATDKAFIELEDHWRIDTDLYANPSSEARPSREPHPLFHFQRGGHAQSAFASELNFIPGDKSGVEGDFRALMQFPGPRVASLPFDPVLAIDFCISQADGNVWQRLRDEPEYFTAIETAQNLVWLPLFEAMSQPEIRRQWLGPNLVV